VSATSGERRVLLVGGSSEIAVAIGERLVADGPVRPYLLGRDRERLTKAGATLEHAGCAPAELKVLDADDLTRHEEVITHAFTRPAGSTSS
jgi:decaprenylphospho-beta-D-erythro-pentofuranosid-2-ulose 2-reductase